MHDDAMTARARHFRARVLDLLAARKVENVDIYTEEMFRVIAECETTTDLGFLVDFALAMAATTLWTSLGPDADDDMFLAGIQAVDESFAAAEETI